MGGRPRTGAGKHPARCPVEPGTPPSPCPAAANRAPFPTICVVDGAQNARSGPRGGEFGLSAPLNTRASGCDDRRSAGPPVGSDRSGPGARGRPVGTADRLPGRAGILDSNPCRRIPASRIPIDVRAETRRGSAGCGPRGRDLTPGRRDRVGAPWLRGVDGRAEPAARVQASTAWRDSPPSGGPSAPARPSPPRYRGHEPSSYARRSGRCRTCPR